MKTFRSYPLLFAFLLVLVTSCSDDEKSQLTPNQEKVSLTFGAVLNDLLKNKQAITDLPECSEGEPNYVQIVLAQGENEVVGTTGVPFRVDLVPGQFFTEEVPELELAPGTFSLTHFAVYNTAGDLIWLAPNDGALGEFIENPLPLTIDMDAGVKKYIDVPVLCFDDREVNEYGYSFFDLNPTELLEFCFFANYCNETGRHYPAAFSVDVWLGTDNTGTLLYDGSNPEMQNSVSMEGEDPSAEPLCMALPDLENFADDEDYLYYEVTLLDWEGIYGDIPNDIISGTLSRNGIQANFDGEDNLEYEHLKFGCDGEQADVDGDGIPDEDDLCPATPADVEVDNNGCPITSCVRTPPDPELCFQIYTEITVTSNGTYEIVYDDEVVAFLHIDVLSWLVTEPEDDFAMRIEVGEDYGSIYDSEIIFPEYDYSECLRLGFAYEEHTVDYEQSEFPFDEELQFPFQVSVKANICSFEN